MAPSSWRPPTATGAPRFTAPSTLPDGRGQPKATAKGLRQTRPWGIFRAVVCHRIPELHACRRPVSRRFPAGRRMSR